MKLRLLFALGLILSATFAWADDNSTVGWVEMADGSFSTPFSTNAAAAYNIGFGGDIFVGYRFDSSFSMGMDSGYFQYNLAHPPAGESGNISYVPLMGVLRFNLMEGPIHPYMFFGVGVAFNSYNYNVPGSVQTLKYSKSETDLFLAPGVGAMFVVSNAMALYIQTRVDLDFISSDFASLNDNPFINIPIEAGVGFYVL